MPPGYGGARDLDHVEGAVSEERTDESCPACGADRLTRTVWRSSPTIVECAICTYHREEEGGEE